MEIILLKDVEKLGKKGEAVNVRDGFGRNFLLPRGLALVATRENRSRAEAEKKQTAARKARGKAGAEAMAHKLERVELRLEVKVGEKDKLFGSVTAQDLADALQRRGFSIDKKQIHLPEPLRSLGKHAVSVELAPEVKASLEVELVKNAKSGTQS